VTFSLQADSSEDESTSLIVDSAAASDGVRFFQSIQQAVNRAGAGDTILVKEGTYHEMVTVCKDGIAIAAYDPSHPPIVDGADPTLGRPTWELVQDKIYRTSYRWYKPQLTSHEFNEYGGGESDDRIAMQVYEDGVLLRGYVGCFIDYGTGGYGAPYSDLSQLDPSNAMFYPDDWYKQEIRIPGRFMYDEQNGKLYVWSAAEDDPNNHTYAVPVLENLVVVRAKNVMLQGLVLANSAGSAVVVDDNSDGVHIEDCCFLSDMYAIYIKHADGTVIARNFIQQKGMWERYWYYDCKNTVLWAHAIAMEHYTDDTDRHTDIYDNVIHGYYAAILANGRVAIHDNILSHCMSTHINVDKDCPEVQIYRNACHHVDDNSVGLAGVLGGPVRIFRNLFYHCGSLNKAGADDPETMNQMCYVYHNTFALSDLISHHPYDYPVFRSHIYRNNIFHLEYLEPGNELYWRYADKNPSLGWAYLPFTNGPDVDYNLYWIGPSGPSRYIAYFSYRGDVAGGYLYNDFAKMQQETELDLHGLQADPLFRGGQIPHADEPNASPYDTLSVADYRIVVAEGLSGPLDAQFERFFDLFAVTPASPAVDRGTSLPADWDDVVEVRDGKPDIGAWEIETADGDPS
jgi:hypothetical protein